MIPQRILNSIIHFRATGYPLLASTDPLLQIHIEVWNLLGEHTRTHAGIGWDTRIKDLPGGWTYTDLTDSLTKRFESVYEMGAFIWTPEDAVNGEETVGDLVAHVVRSVTACDGWEKALTYDTHPTMDFPLDMLPPWFDETSPHCPRPKESTLVFSRKVVAGPKPPHSVTDDRGEVTLRVTGDGGAAVRPPTGLELAYVQQSLEAAGWRLHRTAPQEAAPDAATPPGKYGHTDPLEKLHPGEPYFFLRAQDKLAPRAVADYAQALFDAGDDAGCAECREFAARMLLWQDENPDKVKLPD